MTVRPLALISLFALVVSLPAQEPPRTVAETSHYKETSTHANVVAFCEQLAKLAPDVVRLGDFGTSGEGRKMPLLILADPPVSTPEEAAKSGKLLVFIQANIHAGEVDGKEGVLMLARDIALAKKRPLLKDIVLAICPDVNPDGNEKFAAHRPSQNGPPQVGTRENAEGFDLNRDFVKVETPEGRAMVRFYRRWDPAVMIDMHTTNGSHHRYPLTYDCPRHPAIPADIISFSRDILLPDAGKRLEKATGFPSFFYGNFNRAHTQWEGVEPTPRYGTQCFSFRGRIGILSETYSYSPFEQRVTASREFARAVCESVAAHKDRIRALMKAAEKPPETIALSHKLVAREKPVAVLGYEESVQDGKRVVGKPKEYTVAHIDVAEAGNRVSRPVAYLFSSKLTQVVEALQRQGVQLDELREDIELDYQVDVVEKIMRAARRYQNHQAVTLTVKAGQARSKRFPAGTIVVRTAQPLGTLAAFFLEAQSEDGLVTWNFFDPKLKEGQDYPVARLVKDQPMTTTRTRPLAEDRVMGKRVTPDYVTSATPKVSFSGGPIRGLHWLADGQHFLQAKQGRLWKVAAATGRAEPAFDPAKLKAALARLPPIDAATAEAVSQRIEFDMNPQQTGFLFEHADDLYFAAFDGSKAARLTKTPGKKELATFSPDGNWVAFVRGQNLFVVDLATQTERQLTTDGGGRVSNGKADWVYYEEIFNRNEHAFWWSGDSKHIAFLRFNDTPVPAYTVVDQRPVHPKLEQTPYPKVGDPNPVVQLGIVAAAGGDVAFADLAGYMPPDGLLVRATWTPDNLRLLLYAQDRAQTWLDVLTVPAVGGSPIKFFRETTKAWVEDLGEPLFLADGSFLFASERSGWKHLYHYNKDGTLRHPVTTGKWEVREVHHIDEKAGAVYVSGTRDGSLGLNLYRCPLAGGTPTRLTDSPGTHHVELSPTASYFIDTASNHFTPAQVRLHGPDGAAVRMLDSNPVYALEEFRLGKFELVKIPLKDSTQLEGSLLLPPDFDAKQKYPVWFQTYGGPHTPTVADAWSGRLFDHALANLGIVVFHCDPHSASGKGAESAWTAYRQLGVPELRDVEAAVDWLVAKHPFVDPAKIGMSGHSFGGFLTSFALTHSQRFCAGIAGAPVTDWHNYDTIYTERYMNTPQQNPEGYAKTSVVKAAGQLHGKLLLLHGLIDDNVHFQNSVQLIDALQKANKDFEVMVYPEARHGIHGPHYQKTMLEFIRKAMGR